MEFLSCDKKVVKKLVNFHTLTATGYSLVIQFHSLYHKQFN